MATALNPETFLELVQRAHYECGVQGDPPDSLADASGVNYRLFLWVNEAWKFIQGLHDDWHFLHREFTFPVVAGQTTYTATQAGITEGAVSKWRLNTIRVHHTATGQSSEVPMQWHPYDEFRDTYLISTLRTVQRYPYHFSVHPNMSLLIECPLAGYTISGEAYAAVKGFTADADVPTLEKEDRMAIVYKAMEFYANDENAPEVLATAHSGLKRILNRLETRRLDAITT